MGAPVTLQADYATPAPWQNALLITKVPAPTGPNQLPLNHINSHNCLGWFEWGLKIDFFLWGECDARQLTNFVRLRYASENFIITDQLMMS